MEINNKLEVDVEFSIISDACSIITLAGKSSFGDLLSRLLVVRAMDAVGQLEIDVYE